MWRAGKVEYAHRVAWERRNHKKIPKGLCILHKCDNPACVNPGHLKLGTQQENMLDKVSKGRHKSPYGERSGQAKLTADFVRLIRLAYSRTNLSHRQLATIFRVSHRTIGDVINKKIWRHVNEN